MVVVGCHQDDPRPVSGSGQLHDFNSLVAGVHGVIVQDEAVPGDATLHEFLYQHPTMNAARVGKIHPAAHHDATGKALAEEPHGVRHPGQAVSLQEDDGIGRLQEFMVHQDDEALPFGHQRSDHWIGMPPSMGLLAVRPMTTGLYLG